MIGFKKWEKYKSFFSQISLEVDNIIKTNDYDPIQFYSIIFCYLNYYDYDNFLKMFNILYTQNKDILYEILLIYFSHFINPINQNLDFYVSFLNYTASKKELTIFENGLNYIRDIETFIIVIDKIKELIIVKYAILSKSFKPLKLKDNLELIEEPKNKEIKALISSIKSIIIFSKDKNVLLVYFTSNFWI